MPGTQPVVDGFFGSAVLSGHRTRLDRYRLELSLDPADGPVDQVFRDPIDPARLDQPAAVHDGHPERHLNLRPERVALDGHGHADPDHGHAPCVQSAELQRGGAILRVRVDDPSLAVIGELERPGADHGATFEAVRADDPRQAAAGHAAEQLFGVVKAAKNPVGITLDVGHSREVEHQGVHVFRKISLLVAAGGPRYAAALQAPKAAADQLARFRPAMSISLRPGPSVHVRCDSGLVAGPWRTLPSRANSDPWHGHTKCRLPVSNA